jgi:hypothetical protein
MITWASLANRALLVSLTNAFTFFDDIGGESPGEEYLIDLRPLPVLVHRNGLSLWMPMIFMIDFDWCILLSFLWCLVREWGLVEAFGLSFNDHLDDESIAPWGHLLRTLLETDLALRHSLATLAWAFSEWFGILCSEEEDLVDNAFDMFSPVPVICTSKAYKVFRRAAGLTVAKCWFSQGYLITSRIMVLVLNDLSTFPGGIISSLLRFALMVSSRVSDGAPLSTIYIVETVSRGKRNTRAHTPMSRRPSSQASKERSDLVRPLLQKIMKNELCPAQRVFASSPGSNLRKHLLYKYMYTYIYSRNDRMSVVHYFKILVTKVHFFADNSGNCFPFFLIRHIRLNDTAGSLPGNGNQLSHFRCASRSITYMHIDLHVAPSFRQILHVPCWSSKTPPWGWTQAKGARGLCCNCVKNQKVWWQSQ